MGGNHSAIQMCQKTDWGPGAVAGKGNMQIETQSKYGFSLVGGGSQRRGKVVGLSHYDARRAVSADQGAWKQGAGSHSVPTGGDGAQGVPRGGGAESGALQEGI